MACSISGMFVRKKWKRLRNSFRLQLRKCKHKQNQWLWYNELSFLVEQFQIQDWELEPCTCDEKNDQPPALSMKDEGSSTDESCNLEYSILCEPSTRTFNIDNDISKMPTTSENMLQIHNVTDTDANYYFLMSLLPQISSLPSLKQMRLRLNIQKLIVQEVVSYQNDNLTNGEL